MRRADLLKFPCAVTFNDGGHTTLLKPKDLIEYVAAYMGYDSASLVETLCDVYDEMEENYTFLDDRD